MKAVLLFASLTILTKFSYGLKCYSCSLSGSSDDQTCLKNPAALTTINCPKKFCTTFRQELKDPPELATFSRGCEDTPVFLNKDVVDNVYKTYYRACTKNLCNNGTGKDPIKTGFGNDIGPAGIIYIPGLGSSAINIVAGSLCFHIIITLIQIVL